MAAQEQSQPASPCTFRVDKFVVPAASLEAFLTRLKYVHSILVGLPGLLQRHILTQIDGAGEFNVVTFLEWSDAAAMKAAQEVVQRRFAADGFDPRLMVAELGISPDQGIYIKV